MYSQHHSNQSNSTPSDFRNQFLANAGPNRSRDDLRYDNLLDNDNDDSFDFSGNSASNSRSNKRPYQSINNQSSDTMKKLPNNSVHEYELETLSAPEPPIYNRNYHNNQINPFASNHSSPSRSGYESSHSNPFNGPPLNETTYSPFEPTNPALPITDEYERIRKNEKARLRQLRRKPRFHYTKLPYLTILFTTIQIIVFIVELIKMSQLTGSAFQTRPYFNPMLGPSTYLLINMGARYVPCMHSIKNITDDLTINFPCPNSTTSSTNVCPLNELCGLSGIPIKNEIYAPDQWYRIITPIFLHAGFLHIIFNLLLQVSMGATIEKNIGYIKYFIIYFMSGISGFLLGANFSPIGIASTGASGALFGIVATNIMMFIYCGKKNTNIYGTKRYALFICIMIGEIIVSFVLGLLPGLDNFSHIGGFAMGLLMDIVLLPDPFFIYADGIITYNAHDNTWQQFINNWNPLHNWDDKIPIRFYIWCGIRVICLVLALLYLILLIKNFFGSGTRSNESSCKWCKYINCIPVNGWCEIGEVTVETTNSDGSSSTSSSLATPTSTATSAITVLPSSIENNGQKRRKREYSIFNNPVQQPIKQIDSKNSILDDQNIGIGFYLIIGLITFLFFKKKKLI